MTINDLELVTTHPAVPRGPRAPEKRAAVKTIDLRSDTMTQPTPGLRRAMAAAEVGDDAYGEDRSVTALERYTAELLGKEAALFCSTGTMSNQLALRIHTQPGDEVILDTSHHIHYFESAPSIDLGGVVLNPVTGRDGFLTPQLLQHAIAVKPRGPVYATPRLVCVENTVAFHGGKVVPLAVLRTLREATDLHGLAVHLDGARLPNAAVAAGVSLADYAATADTVSMCFAKGLGAPFGSVLAGPADLINQARRYRKWYGGALHQAGFMAAAALYSLERHYDRLADDHANARLLAELIAGEGGLTVDVGNVESNMVVIGVPDGIDERDFVAVAAEEGVQLMAWGPGRVRATTHLGLNAGDMRVAAERLAELAWRFIRVAV